MHISKEGDLYPRTLLVQGAQHILGPFGVDCDSSIHSAPSRPARCGDSVVISQKWAWFKGLKKSETPFSGTVNV
jgi:hypothetical protein